jgi:hypothetical protein
VLSIKNQPFTSHYDSNGFPIRLYYQIRVKGHYDNIWYYFPDNYSGRSIYTLADNSSYTSREFPYSGNGLEYKYDSIFVYPNDGKVDYQVEAFIGYFNVTNINPSDLITRPDDLIYNYTGQTSGWSNLQTAILPQWSSSETTPSPSPTVQNGNRFSQTFELNQGVYSGIADFDLQVGDRVEGSFSVSNLGPYERMLSNGTSYEQVDVWCEDPNGHSIFNVSATPSENSFNFSFTAQKQGLYRMWTFSGAMDYLKNPKNPAMTLSYDIINATTTPSPTQPTPSPSPTQQPTPSPAFIVIADPPMDFAPTLMLLAVITLTVAIGIAANFYFRRIKK